MSVAEDICSKVTEYLAAGRYKTKVVKYIPDKTDSNITFGNTGLTLKATALHIDLRNSTQIMKAHHKDTIAKLHKAYLHIVATLVTNNEGAIRSFNGDGMLALFVGNTKQTISNAVITALQIKYMLTGPCRTLFEAYDALDFGIGLHHGEMLVVKTGLPGSDKNDLLWIGEPVNYAVKMSDQASKPNNIWISKTVHENLLDEVLYVNKTFWLIVDIPYRQAVWERNTTRISGHNHEVFTSKFCWEL